MKVQLSTAQLTALVNHLANPDALLSQIGKQLQGSAQERIRSTKTAPNGQAWAPWAYSTMIARQKQGTAAKGLLYNSGRLLNSVKYQVQGKQVIVGSDDTAPYARFLQEGTSKMPARKFIGISDADMGVIQKSIRTFIKNR